MIRNPKKGPFELSVDLEKIPSFKSRFMSLDRMTGQCVNTELESVSTKPAQDQEKDLRAKLGTGTDPRSLPSIILRRKGLRVG